MSTMKTAIIKSFHFLMRNDFTSGKEKKRKTNRWVFNRLVSQSIDCGIYYHYGNETLNILQQWKVGSNFKKLHFVLSSRKLQRQFVAQTYDIGEQFLGRCVLLQMNSFKPLPRKSTTVVRHFRLIFQSLNISFFFFLTIVREGLKGNKISLAPFFLYICFYYIKKSTPYWPKSAEIKPL